MMQDSYRFVTFYDLDLMDLKQLGRFRQKTIKQRSQLKIQLTSYVDQVFPELPSDTVPANLSESSGRCSLTK
jgi:transposase